MDNTYSALEKMFRCYLNQDWDADHSSPEEALKDFAEQEPKEWLEKSIVELNDLLNSHDEKELGVFIEKNCDYNPLFENKYQSVSDWLKNVLSVLKNGLSSR